MNITTKIKKIEFKNNYLNLICNDITFKINIIDGTINLNIENTENETVGYTYLEENDIIKVFYERIEKEVLIKKIFVNTKYNLNSESSESETI